MENTMFTKMVASAALMLLTASAAQAASVSVILDQSNQENLLPDGSHYLMVTISDGVDGDIDFSLETLDELFAVSQGSNYGIQSFAFNFGDSGATSDNIVQPDGWRIFDKGAVNFSGFGSFDVILRGTGHSRFDTLEFYLSGVDGDTPFDYIQAASTGNAAQGNVLFGSHVAGFSLTDGWDKKGEFELGSAQFGGSLTVVPLPPAMAMMFSATALLGGMGLRRRKRA
jgi:hypothetical protein